MTALLPLLIISLLLLLGVSSEDECSLDYIRVENKSSHSGVLSWGGGPCEPGSPLEVKHLQWLACKAPSDPSNIPAVTSLYDGQEDSLKLAGLIPFSLYEVSFGGRSARFRTGPDVPDLEPGLLGIRAGKQSLSIYWSRGGNCEARNGEHSGYRVELWGLSPWVLNEGQPLEHRVLSDFIFEYYFQKLRPYTTYAVRVYALNRGVKEVNPGVYLKAKNRTLPTRPSPPKDLQIKSLNRSLFLEWEAEYPPSGEVEFYHIQLKEVDSGVIKKGYYVHRIDERCPGGGSECWVISHRDIAFGQPYSITIQTKNQRIEEPSEYSRPFEFHIPAESTLEELIPSISREKRPQDEEEENEEFHFYHSITLILLAVLGAGITILLVIVVALVFKIKRDRLANSSSYEGTKLSARYRSGSGSTQFTSMGYGPSSFMNRLNDIQSRCLPEPPLDKEPASSGGGNPPEYSQCVEEDETYLDPVSEKTENDLDGYLTPSFVRRPSPSSRSSLPDEELLKSPIQMKSYERVSPLTSDNPSSCNYIDLENVIHQSVEDLIRSKTSSVV
eukprot:TRINITY_DN2175_c0_g1_i1.p1 TRINITY_DN2175_c0_g1~~TRINITY_DN2175_c0_g1_i1.p1  ORF type:complete len:556 (-),score=192.51 TRINITY_DN2175_c0_g1_i1:2142-3809(-)